MAGPRLALKRFVDKAFAKYHLQIKRILLERLRPAAGESKDATYLLPNWNITKLLETARVALAAHIARKDDPHKETIESIGSYSEETIAAKLAAKVPNSVMPVSTYGVQDHLSNSQVAAAWTYIANSFLLTCSREMKVVISGTPYVLPITTIDLTKVVVDPRLKTLYVYLRLRFGRISYEVRDDTPPETSSVMFIGSVTTNATGISSKSFQTVTRIDTFRLSTATRGSVMPVTQGTLDTPTKLPVAWKPL